MPMNESVERVTAAATAAGLEIDVQTYPSGTRTAADAALAVGVDVAQIVKSLVFMVDGQPVLALVSGVHQLDEAALSAANGGGRVRRADADTVRSVTGFAIGGVAPIGTLSNLPVVIDRTLLDHEIVFAAAGRPDAVFGVDPHELARAAGAIAWNLAID